MRKVHWEHYVGDSVLLSELEKSYPEVLRRLSYSTKAADMDYKGQDIFSVKLNKKGRLLLTIKSLSDTPVIVFLELLEQHQYDKSKFLNHPDRVKVVLNDVLKDENKRRFDLLDSTEPAQAEEDADIELAPLKLIGGKTIELSEAQFDLLQLQSWPLEINGLAGSGKTYMLACLIQQALADSADDQRLLYVTKSPRLAREFRTLLGGTIESKELARIEVASYKALVAAVLERPVDDAVGYHAFASWLEGVSKDKLKQITLSPKQVYSEFCLLASLGDKPLGKCWKAYEALGRQSRLESKEVLSPILNLYRSYKKFLEETEKFDPAFERIDPTNHYAYVFIDEYQSFHRTELLAIKGMLDNPANCCLAGDGNQTNLNMQSTAEYRKTLFPDTTKVVLKKNFRSTKKVAEFANRLLGASNRYLGGVVNRDDLCQYDVNEEASQGEVVMFRQSDHRVGDAIMQCQKAVQRYEGSPKFCVIIFDECDRKMAQAQFENSFILTVDEVHGLEFDDGVLLYHPLAHVDNMGLNDSIDWKQLADFKLRVNRPKDKENIFKKERAVLFLHKLFIAATRTRNRLWILDSEKDVSPTKFESYFRYQVDEVCASVDVESDSIAGQVSMTKVLVEGEGAHDKDQSTSQPLIDWLNLVEGMLEEGTVSEERIFSIIEKNCHGISVNILKTLNAQQKLSYINLCKTLIDDETHKIIHIPDELYNFNKDFFNKFFEYKEHVALQIICMLYLDFSDKSKDRLIIRLIESKKSYGRFKKGLLSDLEHAEIFIRGLYEHLVQNDELNLAERFITHCVKDILSSPYSEGGDDLACIFISLSFMSALNRDPSAEDMIGKFESGKYDDSFDLLNKKGEVEFFSKFLGILQKEKSRPLLIRFALSYIKKPLQIDMVDTLLVNYREVLFSVPRIKEDMVEYIFNQIKEKKLRHDLFVKKGLKWFIQKSQVINESGDLFSCLCKYPEGIRILRKLLLEWAPTLTDAEQKIIFSHGDFWPSVAGRGDGFLWRLSFYNRLRDMSLVMSDGNFSCTFQFKKLVTPEDFIKYSPNFCEESCHSDFVSLFRKQPVFFDVVPIDVFLGYKYGLKALKYVVEAVSKDEEALANLILYLGKNTDIFMAFLEHQGVSVELISALTAFPPQAWCMPFNENGDKLVQLLMQSQSLDESLDNPLSLPLLRKIPYEAWFIEVPRPHDTSIENCLIERIALSPNAALLFCENKLDERLLRYEALIEKKTGFRKAPLIFKIYSYFIQQLDLYSKEDQLIFFENMILYFNEYFNVTYEEVGKVVGTPFLYLLMSVDSLRFLLDNFSIFESLIKNNLAENKNFWLMLGSVPFQPVGGSSYENGYLTVFRGFLNNITSMFSGFSVTDIENLKIFLSTVPREVWGYPLLDRNGEVREGAQAEFAMLGALQAIERDYPKLYAILNEHFFFDEELFSLAKTEQAKFLEEIKPTIRQYQLINPDYLKGLMNIEFVTNPAYDPACIHMLKNYYSWRNIKPYTQLLVNFHIQSGNIFSHDGLSSYLMNHGYMENFPILASIIFNMKESVDTIALKVFYFPLPSNGQRKVNFLMLCQSNEACRESLFAHLIGVILDEAQRDLLRNFVSHLVKLSVFFDVYDFLDQFLHIMKLNQSCLVFFFDMLMSDHDLFQKFSSILQSKLPACYGDYKSSAETVMPYLFYDLCTLDGGVQYMIAKMPSIKNAFGQLPDIWSVRFFRHGNTSRFAFIEFVMGFSSILDSQLAKTPPAIISKQVASFIELLNIVPNTLWQQSINPNINDRICQVSSLFFIVRGRCVLLRFGGEALLEKIPYSAWEDKDMQIDQQDSPTSISVLDLIKDLYGDNSRVYMQVCSFYKDKRDASTHQASSVGSDLALFSAASAASAASGAAQGSRAPKL